MTAMSRVWLSLPRTLLPAILLLSVAATRGAAQQAMTDPNYFDKIPRERGGPLHGNEVVKPFRIIGNVYYVGLSENTSFLITSPQGHIILDTTYDSTVPTVAKNVEQLGFKLKDIKYIIQAHAHTDHMEGLARFKELTGAKVLVMAPDVPVVADGGRSDFRSDGRELWKPVRADQTLRDGEQVRVGNATMVAHLAAGHTKGCTTWTTVAEENGRKYNVIFVCSVRLNGANVPLVGNTKYPTIAEDYANSFKTLKSLPVDVFLASHGSMFVLSEKIKRMEQGGANPFMAPQDFRAFLAAH